MYMYVQYVRIKKKCPYLTVVTQYFCNINSCYYMYIAYMYMYYCVGDQMVHTRKTARQKYSKRS